MRVVIAILSSLATIPGTAAAIDLAGARAVAVFVDRAGAERGVVKLGRDERIAQPLPDAAAHGARLRISAGAAGTFDLSLPAERWRAAGAGYRYEGSGGGDPVQRINLVAGAKGGALMIRTRGSLFDIAGEGPDHLEIHFAVGPTEYCARLEAPAAVKGTRGDGTVSFRGVAGACRLEVAGCDIDPLASSLVLRNPVVVIPAMPSGRISFYCDDLAGDSACSCRVDLDPILIPGVGDLCMTAGPGCAAGRLDCGGSAGAEVDVVSDHNIGVCQDNASCGELCADRCSELGSRYQPILSACEAFCAGGANDGWPCAFKQDCPGGFCAGRDGGAGGRSCHCICSATGLGEAPGAPSLTCQASLGLSIDSIEVFGDGICGNGEESITVAPTCQAMTTTVATVLGRNVIDVPGFEIGPTTLAGAAPVCPGLLGGAEPLRLVGSYPTFGRATTDGIFEWSLACRP